VVAKSVEKECEDSIGTFDKLEKIRVGIRKELGKTEGLIKRLQKAESKPKAFMQK